MGGSTRYVSIQTTPPGIMMDIEVRRVLTQAESRAREPGVEPAEFASIYALCVGIIMGAAAAGGMSEEEAQEARARLMTLEIIYQITRQTTLIR
jgi:hypothetical protein